MNDELRSKAERILAILCPKALSDGHPVAQELEGLPNHPGICAVKYRSERILYVGKGKGFKERLKNGHKAFF